MVSRHVNKTADEVSTQHRLKGGLFGEICVCALEDARIIEGLSSVLVCGDHGLDGALALDVAANEVAKLVDVVGRTESLLPG